MTGLAMTDPDNRRLHQSLEFLGMRAHATAVGLVQLTMELHRVGLLDGAAIDRIKDAIAKELVEDAPRSLSRQTYETDVRKRLDAIFTGQEPLGAGP
jgi:hypothetical protein